jgi:probable phosphoglycerate mutase
MGTDRDLGNLSCCPSSRLRPVIYLVRHGQSEWNVARITQGQIAHPRLTSLGRDQARAAATALTRDIAGRTVDVIVTSDLARATESAQIIGGLIAAPLREDVRLREQALGAFEGLSYDETMREAELLDWSDPDLPIGGGETAREVIERMAHVVADLLAEPDSIAIVVTHGDAIRATLGWLAGHPPAAGPWIEVPNGTVVAVTPDRETRWLTEDLVH